MDTPLVVDALLAKLDSMLEDASLSGISRDVFFLIDELNRILVRSVRIRLLNELELELDAQTMGWVIRVRELAYDVEDWVDFYFSGDGSTAPSTRILRCLRSNRHMVPVRGRGVTAASELRELKQRVVGLSWQRDRYGLDSLEALASAPQPDEPVDPRLTTRFVDVGSLVGFDRPIEKVTKMVTGADGEAAELKIVSIVGMAGSGKTTLARAVYQQLTTQQNRFQLHAFVSVGHTPDMCKVLRGMLSDLGDGHREEGPLEDNIDQAILRLRKILENKSYLIVLDDLWSIEHWEVIKLCFPEDSLAVSRIITTTRDLALAEACSSNNCIYNIGLLSEVNSKKLLLNRAFGIGHACPQHLKDVLAQITRRCGGLPLALVTVASMLKDKFSKDEWDRLIGSRWLSHPNAKVMKQILNRSYIHLPIQTKTCLMYLSIFPEYYEVDVDRLVRRLIAEGYIIEVLGLGVEEIAREHISDLISRNMVQTSHLAHSHYAPRSCRLHPVIHDFIVCKSMEDNLVTLVDDQNPPISSNCTLRRLSVQSNKQDQDLTPYDSINLSHVRSISVFGQASAAPRLTNLRVVRVLDLEGCVGPVCLDGLDKLLLLRYLSLKGTDVTELPETIGELRCLQTLDLRDTDVTELPATIGELRCLQTLDLRGTDVTELPATIGELRCLQTLDVRSTKVTELPRSIVGLRDMKALLFSWEGMINSIETATRLAKHCHRLENVATIDLREHPPNFVKALGDLDRLRVLKITWCSLP